MEREGERSSERKAVFILSPGQVRFRRNGCPVVSATDPRSNSAQDLVRTVRGLPSPNGVRVYVAARPPS